MTKQIKSTTKQANIEQSLPVTDQTKHVTPSETPLPAPQLVLTTQKGRVYCGDSLQLLNNQDVVQHGTVNLIMTSPPFGLVRKKEYGNVDADQYIAWFRQFAAAFYRVLADNGSLVIDIGGSWIPGQPTRSLYHYELLIMLCREYGFHLAQDFYWWNPSRLPTPAEWVTVRRIRVKDAVNCIWWESMLELLRNGYKAKLRPSGHDISTKFSTDNGASIPPNLLAIPNTESNSAYLRYCSERNLKMHPARYPALLPEYFIRMLTDPGDLVIDPFAGSCVTGEVAERLNRNWICAELREDYVESARGRFILNEKPTALNGNTEKFYELARPGLLWNGVADAPLPQDGGKTRPSRPVTNGAQLNGTKTTRDEVAEGKVAKTKAAEDYQTPLW